MAPTGAARDISNPNELIKNMAGIYFHTPFCRKRCHYCDFHFSPNLSYRKEMTEAIARELSLRRDFFSPSETVRTLYFGGGTPSILPVEEIGEWLEVAHRHFRIDPGAEITLEANPDDLNGEYLKELRRIGINRLSIGIQSFDDNVLRSLNRSHDARQALRCIPRAQDAGFENLTIDLIYGIPGQNDRLWEKNIDTATSLSPSHLSAYALTVEERTVLSRLIQTGKFPSPCPEDAERQYRILIRRMRENGFLHYEISNFARPGFISRHNSAYWEGAPYLGAGPSAHSFDGKDHRWWNLSSNHAYLKAIQNGTCWFEGETLTDKDLANEMIMTRLRTSKGLDTRQFTARFGGERARKLLHDAQKYLGEGLLAYGEECLTLTEKGLFLSDGICADLFEV